jgi:60 kDa SS-A/Ro ribonucleoprotein
VARTGTHLFLFAGYVEQFRGWGRGLRRAVAQWYLTRDVPATAYQAVKYRQREGWSHRDLLRLAHPVTADPARRALFDWIVRGATDADTPRLVEGFVRANAPGADVAKLVRQYRLSWEMLPSAALTAASTWEALLDNGIAQTALIRQLPRLTRLGLLEPLAGRLDEVCAQLSDGERLRSARVHPMSVLVALNTYSGGRSMAGSSTWEPVAQVVDALDAAFYASFGNVEPSGRRTMLALDVSGSMTAAISGLPLSCRQASAAMALVTAATEPATTTVGFTAGGNGRNWRAAQLTPLAISPRQRLDYALRVVSGLAFGGTDCSLPMQHALQQNLPVDTFVVYTDNETWAGDIHPHQALRQYRERTGIPARLVVVGMTATNVSIADPDDAGMLDVAGFDTAVPSLIADFARG